MAGWRIATKPVPRPASLAAVFLSFVTIGTTSFGGGLTAWIRRELVERRRWLDDQQFLVDLRAEPDGAGRDQREPGGVDRHAAARRSWRAGRASPALLLMPLAILLVLGALYFAAHGAARRQRC